MKTLKERDDIDLLELVCQLHSRTFMHPQNRQMHESYVESRKELESRIVAYQKQKLVNHIDDSQFCDCTKDESDGADVNGNCVHCGRKH